VLFILCVVYLCSHVQSESTKDVNADRSKKQLEELEELNEDRREKELSKRNFFKTEINI
jgi:hypothetical protein